MTESAESRSDRGVEDKSSAEDRKGPIPIAVSAYDRVASLLVALLMWGSVVVAVLFVIWATGSTDELQRMPRVESARGQSQDVRSADEIAAPNTSELPQFEESEFDHELDQLTEAVQVAIASLDSNAMETAAPITGNRPGRSGGRTGVDDGPPPEEDIIPRWERWEIRWEVSDVAEYARRLDFFKIELGAAGGNPHVDYASDLTADPPKHRTGSPKDEDRLYMTWKGGNVQEFDRSLLGLAGIPTDDRLLLQFFPPETESLLAIAERGNAEGRSVGEFCKTVFGVRSGRGEKYEFYVVDQRFRRAPP